MDNPFRLTATRRRSSIACCALFAACLVARSLAGDEPLLPAPNQGGVYVIAHRGAHQGIPENTLAAYRRAIDLGCDFVEVDLRTTSDGEIVSIHNATVDAYTKDARGPVKNFTLAQLKALDIGSRVDPKWKDERIPTFREILELCRDKIGVYVDMKDVRAADAVKLVQEFDMERRCVWYGGPNDLKDVKAASPKCRLMPDPGPAIFLPAVLEQWRPKVVASVQKFCTEDFVQKCHDAGALVFVDEKTPDDWERFLAWKVDGIQTDHPEQLVERLKK
jgi:glycerophosphoryl diester phosphodiesterase